MRVVLRLAFIIALLATGLLLMHLVYRVRIEELGQNIEHAADKTMALRSLGLIAKYQLIQSRMKSGESIALLRREASVSFAGSESVLRGEKEKLPAAYELGLGIVNFVNAIAGAKPVTNRRKSRVELLIEEAYLHELQRNFLEASRTYDALLAAIRPADNNLRAFAHLHRGYCLSFGANRGQAADDYRHVIALQKEGEYRFTAEVLLAYLEEFNQRTGKIAAMSNSTQKGHAYFNVGAYSQAIATLESLPGSAKNSQTDYLLGRSYEEVGRSEKALENYRRLIQSKPQSQYAKLANRRIYALGSIYANGTNLVRESTANAQEKVPDQDLLRENKKSAALAAAVNETQQITRHEILAEKKTSPLPETSSVVALTGETKAPGEINRQIPAPGSKPTAKATARKTRPTSPKVAKRFDAQPKPDPAVNHDALSRQERKSLIQREARIDEVLLADGNRLWGIILEENGKSLSLLTVMGKVAVEKSQITQRSKIDSTAAFQPRR